MSVQQASAQFKKEWRSKECVICMESVVDKGEWFGVINSCDHTYCIPCIDQLDNYAQDEDVSTRCAYCRRDIEYWCPSVLPLTGEDRRKFLNKDEQQLDQIFFLYDQRNSLPKLQSCPMNECQTTIEFKDGHFMCKHGYWECPPPEIDDDIKEFYNCNITEFNILSCFSYFCDILDVY